MKHRIKAVFVSGFNANMEERIAEAKIFESVIAARKFFNTKLLLNKSVFVNGLGYYKLLKVKN